MKYKSLSALFLESVKNNNSLNNVVRALEICNESFNLRLGSKENFYGFFFQQSSEGEIESVKGTFFELRSFWKVFSEYFDELNEMGLFEKGFEIVTAYFAMEFTFHEWRYCKLAMHDKNFQKLLNYIDKIQRKHKLYILAIEKDEITISEKYTLNDLDSPNIFGSLEETIKIILFSLFYNTGFIAITSKGKSLKLDLIHFDAGTWNPCYTSDKYPWK